MDLGFVGGAWGSFVYESPEAVPVVAIIDGRLFVEGVSTVAQFPMAEYRAYGLAGDPCVEVTVTGDSTDGTLTLVQHTTSTSPVGYAEGPCPDEQIDLGELTIPLATHHVAVRPFALHPRVGTCFSEVEHEFPLFPRLEPAWLVHECDGRPGQKEIVAWAAPDEANFEPAVMLSQADELCAAADPRDGRRVRPLIPTSIDWSHGIRHFLCLANVD
jgi:hypothetical protein